MIKIFGDSHAAYFNITDKLRNSFPNLDRIRNRDYSLSVNHDASIKGLGKKKSRKNIKKIINDSINKNDILILNFGQVDVELGLYYQLVVKEKKIELNNYIEDLADTYKNYLSEFCRKTDKVVLKGLNPPVFRYRNFAVNYISKIITENETDADKIIEKKKVLESVVFSISESAAASLYFNKLMSEFSTTISNLSYFDLNDYLIADDGLIRHEFIPSGFDHHIIDSLYTRYIHWYELLAVLEK